MSEVKKINISIKDVVWNYIGTIFNIGMNLFLLPFILRLLPTNELGMWYVFSSMSGLISLIDFGFSPSISRSVTSCWCGADELKKEGLANVTINRNPNYPLLKSLTSACQKIYLIMSIIAIIILLTFGTKYIRELILNNRSDESYYLFAWVIYAFAIVSNLYFSYWSAFLKGIGAIKQTNISTIISRIVYLLLSVIGLLLGKGLIAISLSLLVSGIILWVLARKSFIEVAGIEYLKALYDARNRPKDILVQILPTSSKYGIVSIGGFLSTRAIILLCSYFLGLEVTASYGLTIQVLDFVGSFSQLLFHSYSPMIISARMSNDKNKVFKLLSVTVVFQLIVGLFGVIGVALLGEILLHLIGANAVLLQTNMLLAIGGVLFFEWNSSIFINFIMTSNSIPFAKASIISGALTALLTYILLKYTNLEVWSLIAGKAMIGFAYNYWYWPSYVCREMKTTLKNLLHVGYKSLSTQVIEFASKKCQNAR